MFEDFRKQADEASFPPPEPEVDDLREGLIISEPKLQFLGMTAFQRFALTVLLFLMTFFLGVLFLFITARVVLPAFG